MKLKEEFVSADVPSKYYVGMSPAAGLSQMAAAAQNVEMLSLLRRTTVSTQLTVNNI